MYVSSADSMKPRITVRAQRRESYCTLSLRVELSPTARHTVTDHGQWVVCLICRAACVSCVLGITLHRFSIYGQKCRVREYKLRL